MMGPIDYAGPLAQLANAPTFLDREIQRSLGRAQVDQAEANSALMRQRVAADIADRQQQEQYGREVSMALESGDPRAISSLIARYPQFKDALKTNWDQMDTLRQRSEMRQAAGVWSALNAGNTNAAIKIFEDRITSDRAAGQDTSEDEQAVALLKSGDPKAINTVKGQLGLFMASVVPDKFASVVEQLGTGTEGGRKGQIVGRAIGHYDENGQFVVDYRDPEAFTLNEGQTRFQGGGGVPPSGGFESFYEGFLAPAEGGFVASDGRSGAPANFGVNQAANPDIDVRNLTRDQAKQIMLERYWKPSGADQIADPRLQAIHADTAVNMGVGKAKELLAQSGGDPAQYLALREARYRQLGGKDLDGWLKRNANLAQYAGMAGSQPTAVASVPKAPKVKEAPAGYRWNSSGSALEPIPGGPADKGKSGGGKAVPEWVAKRAEPKFEAVRGLEAAVKGFKDAYGGHTILGDWSNDLQSVFGTGPEGQRDWWAQFSALDNQIRNSLFGASLTEGEKSAYERTSIKPDMKPAQIRKNLQTRLTIAKAAAAREKKFLKANGYDQEALDALLPVEDAPMQAASNGGFRILRVRPK